MTTAHENSVATANVTGSTGETPNNNSASSLCAAQVPRSPMEAPISATLQYKPQHICRASADRQAHSQFTFALTDEKRKHSVDTHCSERYTDTSEQSQQYCSEALAASKSLHNLLDRQCLGERQLRVHRMELTG
jgi:hypothetical protein